MHIWFYYVTNGKKNLSIYYWVMAALERIANVQEARVTLSYCIIHFLHFFQLAYQTPLYAHNSIVQAELFTILLHTCMH